MTQPPHAIDAATCLGCGCTCDDIYVRVERDAIVEARNACGLGVAWFGDGRVPGRARAAGADCTEPQALDAMARVLAAARSPLVYLVPDIACEAQREAVALADLLGATLDSVSSDTVLGSILASQQRGRAGATLGELRNRADVVVFWGVDPSARYPRFQERYAPDPIGVYVPAGRQSRTVVAVDVGDDRGPADADVRVAVAADDEVAALARLAVAVSAPLDAMSQLSGAHGLEPAAAAIRSGRYVAVVADAEPRALGGSRDRQRADALVALSFALHVHTRGALSLLRGGGNRTGADAVSTWQAGFPLGVDFSRGWPRFEPHTGTASVRLSRGTIDAALVVGRGALVPRSVVSLLERIPTCVIGPGASDSLWSDGPAVLDTGIPGIHHGGMVLRMDDVPVPVRGGLAGPPSAEVFARALRERIVAVQRDARVEAPAARIDR